MGRSARCAACACGNIVAMPPDPARFDGQALVQIYRGGISGSTPAVRRSLLARYVERLAAMGHEGVVFHGFPRELAGAWGGLAALASDHGLAALASWGLDAERDNDGTPLTGAEKGALMGTVLAAPTCAAGLADAEGRWDTGTGPDDVTDSDDALAMGEALRKAAPDALVGDQPWFAIDSHGSVRRKPKGADVFEGFPVDEFAVKGVNWYRLRQLYMNQAGFKARWGGRRFEEGHAWMERDWGRIAPALEAAGLDRPLSVTLQMYGWGPDALDDLVWCLLYYRATLRRPVVGWADPFPTGEALRCLDAAQRLIDLGFAGLGVDPVDAVRGFQIEFNRTAPAAKRLVEDGRCGPRTQAVLLGPP